MAEVQRKQDESAANWMKKGTVEDELGSDRETTQEAAQLDRPKPVRSENVREPVRSENVREPVRSENVRGAGDLQPVEADSAAVTGANQGQSGGSQSLFSSSDLGELRARWNKVQANFIDEPRRAVEEADKLVASVTERLAACFANERSGLEKQWDRGEDVSTEDLRVALQRYRTFFSRLLNV